jgi:hypothetical protein
MQVRKSFFVMAIINAGADTINSIKQASEFAAARASPR